MSNKIKIITFAALCLIGTGVAFVCLSPAGSFISRATGYDKSIVATLALIPLDDRPASTQFVQMIGGIADCRMLLPPADALGHFTKPADASKIHNWLMNTDFSHVDGLIVSADMLAYGGLIASRVPTTSVEWAKHRLDVLRDIRKKYPDLPIYLFSSVMRVAPTSEKRTRAFRDDLSYYVQYIERARETQDPKFIAKAEALRKRLTPETINSYFRTRSRNLEVNQYTVQLAKEGIIDYLLLCQDDAQPYGPHHQDQRLVLEKFKKANIENKALLMEGIDEAANVLTSRAILAKLGITPKIAVFYTSEAGRNLPGPFENRPVAKTVEYHAIAAGAQIVSNSSDADYCLYVNTPMRTEAEFKKFTENLIKDVRSGKEVAIADLNFSQYSGGGDTKLIKSLMNSNVGHRVIAYAGWNTPGNTLGTTIPQANLYLMAKRVLFDDTDRMGRCEKAQREFLMHRYVSDYGYHTIVRPKVYNYISTVLHQPVDEMDPACLPQANAYVQEQMNGIIRTFSETMFRGRRFELHSGNQDYTFTIQSIDWQVELPWPRAYEVHVDLNFNTNVRANNQPKGAQSNASARL
ncbi:MAG: DUF4127 family protein [bacterium]